MRGSLIAVAGVGVAVFGAAVWWAAGGDTQGGPPEVHATVAVPVTDAAVAIVHDAAPPPPDAGFADLTGAAEGSIDDTQIYGGLLGSEADQARGLGYGTIGHGPLNPTIALGNPKVLGDLDHGVIRRLLKRNKSKLLYCYEKALLSIPKLAGTLDVVFYIAPDGAVTMAEGHGLDEIAGCVTDVIRAIAFPKPKAGGGVQVNDAITFAAKAGSR